TTIDDRVLIEAQQISASLRKTIESLRSVLENRPHPSGTFGKTAEALEDINGRMQNVLDRYSEIQAK
ncbi:hypothetical protein PENTCL1PPCAC_1490, partial [Pristionchus entomophagus]